MPVDANQFRQLFRGEAKPNRKRKSFPILPGKRGKEDREFMNCRVFLGASEKSSELICKRSAGGVPRPAKIGIGSMTPAI